MSKDKILTKHPQKGKKGVNISKQKYDQIKSFILETLAEHGAMEYQEINDVAIKKLSPSFDGSVPWYVVTVKLDLEARNIIRRIPKTSPHQIELVS